MMHVQDEVLLRFLSKDKDISSLQFNDEMANRLASFLAAAPDGGISIFSGYRSPEHQAELFSAAVKKYGSERAARHWVAPPGRSNHNRGIAADLRFSTPELKAWAHANAERFGLRFRMGHEPWHIELASGVTPETNHEIAKAAYPSKDRAYEQMIYDQQLAAAPIEEQVLSNMGVK